MFALGIRYLNGWSMAAADGARKERAEWPPHPDRVFMALAAAWFETGEDTDEHAREGDALRWLQALPPPAIAASGAGYRTSVTSYVPVNDIAIKRGRKRNPKTDVDKLRNEGLALVPEHRLRQPRGFPVAIPHDPVVRLIWREAELDAHRAALERLAAKVTHVGHSASFVQAWVEQECEVAANWEPIEGIAVHRLRVPSAGGLDRLARTCNREAWIAYHDLRDELERAQAALKAMKPPPRVAWRDFPDAVLLADETRTMRHPAYSDAKAGDAGAATNLVHALVDEAGIAAVRRLLDAVGAALSVLVSAHAYEREGVNAIPAALAKLLSNRLGVPFDTAVVQTNVVGHTGASGYGRLARQAAFGGEVEQDREYVMVDDFIGQGGTLANLRGWIEKQGGRVVGAVGLTGKPYSAKLNPSEEQLHELRQKHGSDFEKWWREHFGHAFDCLTQSEARYLARSPDADTIRDRLAAAEREGGGRGRRRNPREQRRHVNGLKERLADRFPDGPPPAPMRPVPGRWQGYGRPQPASPEEPEPLSVFDPRFVVLALGGKRVSLPATLRLTAALRGLLMRNCPVQPPPEWFSGHRPDGKATAAPHMALAPLAFTGSRHADGSIMGLALILPRGLEPQEAGRCLEPILTDPETGLSRDDLRLFDGDRLESPVELEARERPPANLAPRTWTRASRVWASVTPVALNRHFDGRDKWERAAESVKDMCGHVGLPRPREVLLHPVSLVEGVPRAREFPQLTRRRDGGRQWHGHAVLIFDEPVCGPVLIGAGRFRGYGLCRPIDEGGGGGSGRGG